MVIFTKINFPLELILHEIFEFPTFGKQITLLRKQSILYMKNHWLEAVLQLSENVIETPYKTCRLLIHLGPFSGKDPQKYQKSITFFTKS